MKQSEVTKIYSGKTSQQSNGLCGSHTLKLKEKEKNLPPIENIAYKSLSLLKTKKIAPTTPLRIHFLNLAWSQY